MSEEEGKGGGGEEQPIIVKKIKKGGGHHGGAWKVAYADFVTAMMAFFLLLWLLNVTTEQQKNAISNYFDPSHPKISQNTSGAGGVLGGLTVAPKGAQSSNVQPLTQPKPTGKAGKGTKGDKKSKSRSKTEKEKRREAVRKKEDEAFKKTAEALKKAVESNPELAELAKNLIVDVTPEGLRIQVVDQDGKPMFPSGSAQMFEHTRLLITQIASLIKDLENEISVRGHTDSSPYGAGATYTNWELSADRANASRRALINAEIPETKVNNVMGKADREHLIPEEPLNASNRRISIILLREELTNPELQDHPDDIEEEEFESDEEYIDEDYEEAPAQVPLGTFRRTPGAVQFP